MSNFGRLDLNLLVTLDVLLMELNVTRAAERLSLSQPSVSAHLAKLRAFSTIRCCCRAPEVCGQRPERRLYVNLCGRRWKCWNTPFHPSARLRRPVRISPGALPHPIMANPRCCCPHWHGFVRPLPTAGWQCWNWHQPGLPGRRRWGDRSGLSHSGLRTIRDASTRVIQGEVCVGGPHWSPCVDGSPDAGAI